MGRHWITDGSPLDYRWVATTVRTPFNAHCIYRSLAMGRRRTTSKMPVDVPVTDEAEDSSPSATDHDFVSFVRSTLSALNTKMDNLLSNQAAFESKLEAIERRVTINTTVTTELSRATEFNANTIGLYRDVWIAAIA